jgi:hypothetical protein
LAAVNAKATKEMRAKYLADPSSLDAATMINDTLATQKLAVNLYKQNMPFSADIYKKVAQRLGAACEAQCIKLGLLMAKKQA